MFTARVPAANDSIRISMGEIFRLLRRGGAPGGIAADAMAALEERAAFARFGL